MRMFTPRLLVTLPALTVMAACATAPATGRVEAPPTASPIPVIAPVDAPVAMSEQFEQDRAAILAMTGDYRVTFDFTETVSFVEGYELKPPKLSGGFEVVRVVEDTGDFISLQHVLVAGPADNPMIIKHWRQDWQYEPAEVMVFIGGNAWEMQEIAPAASTGQWSQTVYQVDDSPRYGAVGAWNHDDGISEWTPPAEWRPLPRRDMTTRSDYHAVDAVNRHTITPFGWVHEQDNTKLILGGNAHVALVREIGVNTYRHSDEFDPAPAVAYMESTEGYWAHIRESWETIASEHDHFAIQLQGETEALYIPLLTIADELNSDAISSVEEANMQADAIMSAFVTDQIGRLTSRLRPTEAVLASN